MRAPTIKETATTVLYAPVNLVKGVASAIHGLFSKIGQVAASAFNAIASIFTKAKSSKTAVSLKDRVAPVVQATATAAAVAAQVRQVSAPIIGEENGPLTRQQAIDSLTPKQKQRFDQLQKDTRTQTAQERQDAYLAKTVK